MLTTASQQLLCHQLTIKSEFTPGYTFAFPHPTCPSHIAMPFDCLLTVVLWMTGGPGCSSELAVFYENGPYSINPDLTLSETQYGWDRYHTTVFVDQPINTGFSYSDVRGGGSGLGCVAAPRGAPGTPRTSSNHFLALLCCQLQPAFSQPWRLRRCVGVLSPCHQLAIQSTQTIRM